MLSPQDLREAADDIASQSSLLDALEQAILEREVLALNYTFSFFLISDGTIVMFADQTGTGCVYYAVMALTEHNAMISEISTVLESSNLLTYSELDDLFACFDGDDPSDLYEAIVLKAMKSSVQKILMRRCI